MIKKSYDVVIVGAGIAGLYAAYKIKTMTPELRFLVLEANPAKWIGGRMGVVPFQGTHVVTGAGIGRKRKDHLLIQLLEELKIKYREFPHSHHYSCQMYEPCNVKKAMELLREKHPKHSIGKTFQEFAVSVLGKPVYTWFLTCSGYRDYENEDSYDTLYHYGFEDNYGKWIGLSIPWGKLVDTLVKKIGKENIISNCKVMRIQPIELALGSVKDKQEYEVDTVLGKRFLARKVIVATTIESLRQLFPNNSIYQDIQGQPFLRLYGKFSKSSIPIMQKYVLGYTVVPGLLQKIIPLEPEKGIYMIAYADNECAEQLEPHLKNTATNRAYFEALLEKALGIRKGDGELHLISILSIYWPIGTHYYRPLQYPNQNETRSKFIRKAQHPAPDVLVVGEVVSKNQGWVEGALDSVEKVVTLSWLHK